MQILNIECGFYKIIKKKKNLISSKETEHIYYNPKGRKTQIQL